MRINATKAPARGAREARLRAEFMLEYGDDMRTAETRVVALRKDSELDAGPLAFQVTRAEKHTGDALPFPFPEVDKKPKKADPATSVTLFVPKDFERIQTIEWLGAEGKPIPARQDGYGVGLGVSLDYVLTGEIREARLRITWFAETRKVRVPVDLRVGLGP